MKDATPTIDEPGRQPVPSGGDISSPTPEHIGRYQVERVLGRGSFGIVYLARDGQLQRLVAIKVPHRHLVLQPEDVGAYLVEARTVASLEHPNIVPVFDVGENEDWPVFIVSKFIDGTTLAKRITGNRLSHRGTAELVKTLAETLHYAHGKGIVHRDIKPGNILLDNSGKPFVTDFGLALREQDVGRGPRCAGTLPYMSPEQARGEGHRVDGRSDIFSLGAVLYELLCGKRPFYADSNEELLDQIVSMDARPPRQIDDTIPKELERICLKALAKKASDRYSVSRDLAEDLQLYLASTSAEATSKTTGPAQTAALSDISSAKPTSHTATDNQPVTIVPKGLRSFDAEDEDFFLRLLPGPRDREGLPDSIRFWKTRIENRNQDDTFAVGVLYGPSGCGKSSLVKAGLLPRLSREVIAVYLEATPAETETRLLNGLYKRIPALRAGLSPKGALAALRRNQGIPPGKKVLIVLDQFEQWLHAKQGSAETDLVLALRQCDGERLQCILMVRDDFWMATTRLMRQLEIRLVEGQNSASVDLFDVDHARKVLTAFGRAYGKLPESPHDISREQKQFVERAIAGLAPDGKVVCVRLAVFAEMMKGKPWNPAFLKSVGGAAGLGVTFLEETFSAPTAPPQHRVVQKAARAVLAALLPQPGTDLKAHMKSSVQLREASGYNKTATKEFDDLLRILDTELRLITPTDPEGETRPVPAAAEGKASPTSQGAKSSSMRFYQLTHDYLVHSLREWLTRKQKESMRGRAELLLADFAAVWNARPAQRLLPSLWQWSTLRLLTKRRNWTPPQRRLMERAGKRHAARIVVFAVLLATVGWGVYEWFGRLRAEALRDQLLKADTQNVPGIVADMTPYRRWIDPLLREKYGQAWSDGDADPRLQLHASMALLPVDAGQTTYLYARLLDAAPQDVPVLCDVLASQQDNLREVLWTVVEHPTPGMEHQRLRAACALAKYDPQNQRWRPVSESVVEDFVSVPPVYLERWADSLRPIKSSLREPLEVVFRDTRYPETKRALATSILADYLADQPAALTSLLLDADERQFAIILERLQDQRETTRVLLINELAKRLDDAIDENGKERMAKQHANAAVALLRMNWPDGVWPLFKHTEDPRIRSYLIHRLGPMGADPRAIVRRLQEESDVTIRRALILSLGGIKTDRWQSGEREAFLADLQDLYRTARDPGLRASAARLLGQWGQHKWMKQIDREFAGDEERRQKVIRDVAETFAKEGNRALSQWYVNSVGQTMIVVPGPVEFMMGPRGQGREPSQHRHRIGYPFAVSATPVTVEQYRRKDQPTARSQDPQADHPVVFKSWFEAASYCNWLSQQENIPREQWCYETDAQGRLRLGEKYLSRAGYRLPTEAEMEYTNRAGAVTRRFYGESEELLENYGWYVPNSKGHNWPVGRLKPNDLGFFDTHGNVWCWCQESFRKYPVGDRGEVFEDQEGEVLIDPKQRRAVRGNCYTDHGEGIGCANAWYPEAAYQSNLVGFRVAKTIRPD